MVELALLKALLNKETYIKNTGGRCPDKIFSKEVRKIKAVLDTAMIDTDCSLCVTDLEALFLSSNLSMTTANKKEYQELFTKMRDAEVPNEAVTSKALSNMFQAYLGKEIANLGFNFVNNEGDSLEPLRNILDNYKDDFTPDFSFEGEDIDFNTILEANEKEEQWKFNIPSLRHHLEGISGGHFIVVGARPNTGKTSFHASIIQGQGGFASQGAKCLVLCNEEDYTRIMFRYIQVSSRMNKDEIYADKPTALARYKQNIKGLTVKDSTGKNLVWVENVVKLLRPDIVVLDMGDKFATKTSDRSDIYLKDAAIHARNIAKLYKCAVFWMSQLSAVAEDKVYLDQSMLEGSKTGKAAESDLMLLLSKNPLVEGVDTLETKDPVRYINIAKNKLNGYHGLIRCSLDVDRGIYQV
jgi:hypothetical protein